MPISEENVVDIERAEARDSRRQDGDGVHVERPTPADCAGLTGTSRRARVRQVPFDTSAFIIGDPADGDYPF